MTAKRILYLGAHYHPAPGGAEITDQILLEHWVQAGGTALALVPGHGPGEQVRGVQFQPLRTAGRIFTEARRFQPDLIYSQIGSHPLGLALRRELGVPVMTCLHDSSPICPDLAAQVHCDRVCESCPHFYRQPVHRTRALLSRFDHILAPSRYLADLANQLLGRADVTILHPAVLPLPALPEEERNVIAMSTLDPSKGTDTFIRIAELMPDCQFRAAGRGQARACGFDPRRHTNLEIVGPLPQADFYRGVWLVLMPSRWAESFGRMAPEAQSGGILFMGSRVGGIPEAAGDAGILVGDYENPAAWVAEIRALQQDPERQRRLRDAGRRDWSRFAVGPATAQFNALAQDLAAGSRPAPLPPGLPEPPGPPWAVSGSLRGLFLAAQVLAMPGAVLAALGHGQGWLQVPVGLLAIAMAAIWARHARPLLKQGATQNRAPGIKLAAAGALLFGVTLLAAVRPTLAWAALGCLLFLVFRSGKHLHKAQTNRTWWTGLPARRGRPAL